MLPICYVDVQVARSELHHIGFRLGTEQFQQRGIRRHNRAIRKRSIQSHWNPLEQLLIVISRSIEVDLGFSLSGPVIEGDLDRKVTPMVDDAAHDVDPALFRTRDIHRKVLQ